VVKLITQALSSGDFIVTPDLRSASHLKNFFLWPSQIAARRWHSRHDAARHRCQHGHSLATDAKRQL